MSAAQIVVFKNATTAQVTNPPIQVPPDTTYADWYLFVKSVSGGSVAPSFYYPTGDGNVTLLTGGSQTAVGSYTYRMGPGLNSAANAVVNQIVPPLIIVQTSITGTITYSLYAVFK
ncbi:MAG: hypothetical protein KGL39_04295 [Patescibacteria group bacterium]|nr:hypothetical protein [Patescibacteria group bacterium]